MTIGEVFGLAAYSGGMAAMLVIVVTIVGGDMLERALKRFVCRRVGHKETQYPGTFFHRCERCGSVYNVRTNTVTIP